MHSFEQILQFIDDSISQIHLDSQPKSLFEPIKYTLSLGGKRVRPALTLMAYNLYRNDIEVAINPALAMEIFHNFTLLHDDLMDAADKRRGLPTVHKKWNSNTAVLSGDAMLIIAYQFIEKTASPFLADILKLFGQTALEICEGQQYDMEFESMSNVSEDDYIEMIRLKTAVLLACSLKTGAILAGASNKDAEALYRYGINIGLAFQLQDDWLDVYGDTATFGKNIGGDILSNKKTFLLINAIKKASPAQIAIMQKLQTITEKDSAEKIAHKIETITNIYNELQIDELTKQNINSYTQLAVDELNKISLPKDKFIVFDKLNAELINRQS